MGENQAGVTKGIRMEEHLFTVQLIVSRQETEFEQIVCSCRLRKGIKFHTERADYQGVE